MPLIGKQKLALEPRSSKLGVLAIFLFPALGGLLFGFDIGGTSAVLSLLKSANFSGLEWSYIVSKSAALQGLITSIGIAGAIVGSMICFRVGDDIGRRKELLISALLFMIGGLIECQSGAFQKEIQFKAGIFMLLVGRIVYGIACGFAMHGAPAYIAEMAPASIRGLLISLKEGFIVIGILLGYVIGFVYDETIGGWRNVYSASIIFGAIMFAGMFFLPRSSRWLLLKGLKDEAWHSLLYVTPDASQTDFDELVKSMDDAKTAHSKEETGNWDKLLSGPCRLALIAGCGVVVLQQITGQPSVLYYANTIFEDVGLGDIASVLVGSFKLVATLYAVFTVDSQGRKKLLFIGVGMMFAALIVLAVAFAFPYTSTSDCNALNTADTCIDQCRWKSPTCLCDELDPLCYCCGVGSLDFQKMSILAAMFLYIGGYQVGFGPIAWLLISEVFPLELRGKAISVAVVINFVTMTLMTFEFPIELQYLGTSPTFLIFAIIDAYALYFIYQHVPETKGLSLEEIEQFFQNKFEANSIAEAANVEKVLV